MQYLTLIVIPVYYDVTSALDKTYEIRQQILYKNIVEYLYALFNYYA